jgi:hypothetical protein
MMGEEIGMSRPFVLSLVALILVGGGVAVAQPTPDVSTWRWNVSVILAAQHTSAPIVGAAPAESFRQRFNRYSVSGLPEVPAAAGPR